MSNHDGIVDEARNPFACDCWITQPCCLTPHRRRQAEDLLGKTIGEIKEVGGNEGCYPAFVAIRRGFAEIKDGRLAKVPG